MQQMRRGLGQTPEVRRASASTDGLAYIAVVVAIVMFALVDLIIPTSHAWNILGLVSGCDSNLDHSHS